MGTVLITTIILALIEAALEWLDYLFYPLCNWLDGAVIEIDEDDLSDYMDNSEYDWGHNVKGYRFEE